MPDLFTEIDRNQRFMGRKPEAWMIRVAERIESCIKRNMDSSGGPKADEITVYICLALEEEKGASKAKRKSSDDRHTPVREKIFEAYRYFNKTNPAWGAKEAGCLATFLKAHDWSTDKIFQCIRNRFKSEENLAQEPCRWISRLGDFAAGPLDKFGKPKYLSNGNGHYQKPEGGILSMYPTPEENEAQRKKDEARLAARRNQMAGR